MRKIFRLLLLFGSLVLLIAVGVLTFVYLARVRLAQIALERIFENTEFVESRASVDSITPRSLVISDLVLAGEGWHFELAEVRSTHDAWSLRIHEIETGEGRLFVNVDQVLQAPSTKSKDEIADLIEAIQSALPEMDFVVNSIQTELVYRGRRVELTVSGKGRVSSVDQLAVSLEAVWGNLVAEVALRGDQADQVLEITGTGRVAKLAQWMGQVAPTWQDDLPFDGPFDLDASSVTGGFHLELARLRPVTFQANANLACLEACFRDRELWLDGLDLVVRWTPGKDAEFEAVSSGARLNDGRVKIDVPHSRIAGRIGESIVISSEYASVESEQVSGSIEFGATVPWPDTRRLPIGTLVEGSITRLTAFDRGWKPIDFDLGVESDFARLRAPRVATLEADWPVLSDLDVILPLGGGGFDRLNWSAVVDLAVDSAGPVSTESDSALSVSGDVAGLGTDAIRGNVRVEPLEDRVGVFVDGIGSLNTSGGLNIMLAMGGDERISAEIDLRLEALGLSMDRVEAEIASFSFELSVPPTPMARLLGLSELSLFERVDFVSGLDLKMELVGDRLSLPGEVVLEWFDFNHVQGPEWRGGRGGSDFQVSVSVANLRVAGESLHNVEIVRQVTFADREIRSGGYLKALFEGSPMTGQFDEQFFFGDDGQPVEVRSRVVFDPFEIRQSDLVSRHFSAAAGLSMGAVLTLSADAWWSRERPWDLSIGLSVSDGSLIYPPKNLQVEEIEGSLEIASLRDLRVAPGTSWGFRRLTASDLAMDRGRIIFGFDGTDRLDISNLSFEVFEGQIHLEPFSYSIAEKSADVELHVTGLDVGVLLEQLDFFEGSFEGSVDGAVPFTIRNGRFIPEKGRLGLTPGIPAAFHYRAEGFLTRGEKAETIGDQLRLLPLQLAEKGLSNIQVDVLTIDLFDPDYPSSPARIHLAGKALAEETEIPYIITTNINGTVAELLNFLLRLSSL